jgi:prevent-host-death family protein
MPKKTAKGARCIGIREAKAGLSRLLREVARGHEWVITERGTPVAKLVAVGGAELGLSERVARLERLGIITRPAKSLPLPPPIRVKSGAAQERLQADRG